ncbi:MAG: response regulator [Scytolyngbya sp. HA4215-MV1]|jgi:diguanylate cyclase (GGDEF)-like protein|nr:response regulator [Scytolyngbya sp. HA4215-MV1]
MKLLVVDDDINLAKAIAKVLAQQKYLIDVATDGQSAWEYTQSCLYDLIVLDVKLPSIDGISLCQKLRQEGYVNPILLLTACDSSSDKVLGLDAGADDYVIKPFDWEEFLARIRALLRRAGELAPAILSWGALRLDPITCEVSHAGELLPLRPREYKLLELFMRNSKRVFSCGAILEHLWSFEDPPSEDAVRAHIKGLRQKFKMVGAEDLIETVYGLGYRLKPLEEKTSAELLVEGEPIAETADPLETVGRLQQALAEAWDDIQPEMLERVIFLEQVLNRLKMGAIDPQLQQQAASEAHKLVGTVGAYGFKFSSELSRQIETLLRDDRPFDSTRIASLTEKLAALSQDLAGAAQVTQSYPSPFVDVLYLPESTHSVRLLAVDDDPHVLANLKTVLEPWGIHLTTLVDPQRFWEYLEKTNPDLLLLDVVMPNGNGLELCESVRNSPDWAGLPIVFLTAYRDTETVQRAFLAGADDLVCKPVVAPELITRVMSRIERQRFWRHLAERDGLTQLANRVKFTRDLHQLIQKAASRNQSIALVILSIQGLNKINHQYGYAVGDAVLHQVGSALNPILCKGDLLARWSGNKFAIALCNKFSSYAFQQVSVAIADFAQKGVPISAVGQVQLKFSLGTAQYPQDGSNVQMICEVAEFSLLS